MSSRSFRKSGVLALAIVLALLIEGAVPAFAGNGKKYFKEGIRLAENKQWDKAAERLALAVAEEPSNAEYQMHLQRALVNAAILFVERGDHLAAQKDYNAAYSAYRQACAFDSTNEVAAMKMRHMLEAQGLPVDKKLTANNAPQAASGTANLGTTVAAVKGKDATVTGGGQIPARPARLSKTDVIIHNGSLPGIIEQIAQTIHLNVAFDQQIEAMMKSKTVNIELRDVTAGEALEIILQINNLMYVQVGLRTIVITTDTPQSRARYEPMSVRTFYIKNADINDLRAAVTATIGTKQIVASKQLNAIVVRDSKSNLELIDSMIASLDKSKAEVLIDVDLYEVSKNDLLQLGNQLATGTTGVTLSQFGGVNQQSNVLGAAARTLTGPLGFALGMPSTTLSLFQDKGKARLLASTQVHVLDNEQHQVRIGQRVPIKTGTSSILGVTSTTTTSNSTSSGLTALDTIQYENVGLNIDMQPQVFEDEVQVKMKIESSSVDRSTGELTPSFNQRTMSSVARIKDGQTTMIAGVSRTEDSREVKGIPIIGLIPILGRFFTTPSTSNQQSDVVITVTPHILRRADITNDDHLSKDAGRGNDPDRQLTIQQILNIANETENTQNPVAVDTGVEKSTPIQITANQPPTAAPATQIPLAAGGSGIVKTSVIGTSLGTPAATSAGPQIERRPVASPGVQTQAADNEDDDDDDDDSAESSNGPTEISLRSSASAATIGQDFYVAVYLNGDAKISSATIALDYDPNLFDVKRVASSGLLRATPQFTADGGRLTVQISQSATSVLARGQLLLIVLTAKAGGRSPLNLNGATVLYSSTGQTLPIKLQGAEVAIK